MIPRFSELCVGALLRCLDEPAEAQRNRELLALEQWVRETGGFESEAEVNAAVVGYLIGYEAGRGE